MSATTRAMPRPAASAHRVARSSKFRVLARVGMAGHGAIYLLIGVLALALASGDRSKETDQSGALQTLANTTGGWALLLVIAIGLAAYALWQLVHGAFGDDEAKQRLANVGRGLLYGALSVSAFAVVIGGHTSSQSKSQQTWTARVMQHTGGRWAIGLAGVAVVVVGAVLCYWGAKRKFEEHFDMARMSAGARKATVFFGVVGGCARGVVVAMIGVLLTTAAVQYDPKQARGVDGALRALRDTPLGPWLLAAVAVGLVMFGIFGFCEARWRNL